MGTFKWKVNLGDVLGSRAWLERGSVLLSWARGGTSSSSLSRSKSKFVISAADLFTECNLSLKDGEVTVFWEKVVVELTDWVCPGCWEEQMIELVMGTEGMFLLVVGVVVQVGLMVGEDGLFWVVGGGV